MKPNIHSKFIVHWTGKNISKLLPLSSSDSDLYLESLKNIIKEGLLMSIGSETIHGRLNTYIQAQNARVCFTEIKLSKVKQHAFKYGLLGIGFGRKFIYERYGNPVFYVQNNLNYGVVVETMDYLRGYFGKKKVSNDSEADKMLKYLEVILSLVKNMSEKTSSSEFDCYDEMEWRITHLDHMEKSGLIEITNRNYYLKIESSDIKILVFPDERTKENALNDPWLKDKIFTHHIPVIATLEECENF